MSHITRQRAALAATLALAAGNLCGVATAASAADDKPITWRGGFKQIDRCGATRDTLEFRDSSTQKPLGHPTMAIRIDGETRPMPDGIYRFRPGDYDTNGTIKRYDALLGGHRSPVVFQGGRGTSAPCPAPATATPQGPLQIALDASPGNPSPMLSWKAPAGLGPGVTYTVRRQFVYDDISWNDTVLLQDSTATRLDVGEMYWATYDFTVVATDTRGRQKQQTVRHHFPGATAEYIDINPTTTSFSPGWFMSAHESYHEKTAAIATQDRATATLTVTTGPAAAAVQLLGTVYATGGDAELIVDGKSVMVTKTAKVTDRNYQQTIGWAALTPGKHTIQVTAHQRPDQRLVLDGLRILRYS